MQNIFTLEKLQELKQGQISRFPVLCWCATAIDNNLSSDIVAGKDLSIGTTSRLG